MKIIIYKNTTKILQRSSHSPVDTAPATFLPATSGCKAPATVQLTASHGESTASIHWSRPRVINSQRTNHVIYCEKVLISPH
jgi:hypothetical protein